MLHCEGVTIRIGAFAYTLAHSRTAHVLTLVFGHDVWAMVEIVVGDSVVCDCMGHAGVAAGVAVVADTDDPTY